MRFPDKLYVVRAGQVASPDGGDPVQSWAEASVTVTPCWGWAPQPLSSVELVVAQQRTDSTHRTFLAPGTDVTARDRIRYGGATPGAGVVDRDVDGDPERWPNRRGGESHVEVMLKRTAGG